MTAGTVVVLGDVGLNFAAGMSAGDVYVYDPAGTLRARLADGLVERELDPQELAPLRELVERHARTTGSSRAGRLLERWDDESGHFRRVTPQPAASTPELSDDVAAAGVAS